MSGRDVFSTFNSVATVDSSITVDRISSFLGKGLGLEEAVDGRYDEQGEQRGSYQPSDDNHGQWPLHLGACACGYRSGKQSESGGQRSHQDRPQARQGTIKGRLLYGGAFATQVDDVIHQDHTVENGNPEQRDEPHAGGDRKGQARRPEGKDASRGCDRHV